mgnify:CR=1 FL=1
MSLAPTDPLMFEASRVFAALLLAGSVAIALTLSSIPLTGAVSNGLLRGLRWFFWLYAAAYGWLLMADMLYAQGVWSLYTYAFVRQVVARAIQVCALARLGWALFGARRGTHGA